jgi:hypothetical protein
MLTRLLRGWPRAFRRQWTLFAVLLVVVVGLVLIHLQHWRRGSFLIGCAVLLACGFRAVLPEPAVGLLHVRSKWFDVAFTGVLGAGIAVMAILVPGVPFAG